MQINKRGTKMKKINQIKYGAILSYLVIIINSVYGLLVAPFIIKYVGAAEYGVYKTMASLSASLTVLDLGFGSTVTRYIAKYRAENNKKEAENFLGMTFVEVGVLSALVLIVGVVLSVFIRPMYSTSFDSSQINLAYTLYFIMLANICLNFFDHVFAGIIKGNERFVFVNVLRISSLIIRISSIFIFIPIFKSVVVTSVVALSISVIVTLCYVVYVGRKLHFKIKLHHWDKNLFKESFGYTALMFIQSVIVQFNGNVDNVVIGAYKGALLVTVYSFALQIFGMFENLSCSFSGLMLPKVSKKIYDGASPHELQNMVSKTGRYQFAVLGAALGGFLVLGKDFFVLWLGKGYEDCWLLSLILMVPTMFPLVQNTSLAILRAKNLMKFRTVSLMISFIANCLLTVIGTKYFGYWAAAIGTASSTVISLITMNIYYHKKLNFRIFKLFYDVFKRTSVCIIVATAAVFVLHKFVNGSWFAFIINVVVFMLIYGATMLLYGFDKEEIRTVIRR